jgi:serine/threonine-protein kinase
VSYAALRDAGVELPASVVSELQLVGVPVERCHGGSGEVRGGAGVRLDPARDPASADVSSRAEARRPPSPDARLGAVTAHTERPQPVAARTRGDAGRSRALAGNPGRRWLAVLALLGGGGAVVALVVASLGGAGRGARSPAAHRHSAKPTPSSTALADTDRGPRVNTAREPPTAHRPPPTPVSAALATQLEARGHGLLESGRYEDAVPVLRRALAATGESLPACLQPAGGTCLTYAYALYDLGRALRLAGHPAAAVPILERRLEIDNQRSTVEAELELARRAAA